MVNVVYHVVNGRHAVLHVEGHAGDTHDAAVPLDHLQLGVGQIGRVCVPALDVDVADHGGLFRDLIGVPQRLGAAVAEVNEHPHLFHLLDDPDAQRAQPGVVPLPVALAAPDAVLRGVVELHAPDAQPVEDADELYIVLKLTRVLQHHDNAQLAFLLGAQDVARIPHDEHLVLVFVHQVPEVAYLADRLPERRGDGHGQHGARDARPAYLVEVRAGHPAVVHPVNDDGRLVDAPCAGADARAGGHWSCHCSLLIGVGLDSA
ncbi:MAG: hypothetical protein AAB502_02615 [Chloroflexota bacterium]